MTCQTELTPVNEIDTIQILLFFFGFCFVYLALCEALGWFYFELFFFGSSVSFLFSIKLYEMLANLILTKNVGLKMTYFIASLRSNLKRQSQYQ